MRSVSGTVKLRGVNKDSGNLGLTIPAYLSQSLQHLVGRSFLCELTDEGILFRPVETVEPAEAPAWAKGDA